MNLFKKSIIAAGLAATALAGASPAMARDWHGGGYRGHSNTAGVAIGAGILGLAVGAIAASASNNHGYDRGGYDDAYYGDDDAYYSPAYTSGWAWRDGYYWDRDGGRHSREDYARYHNGGPRGGGYGDNRGGWQGQDHRGDDRGDRGGDYRRGYDHDRDDARRGY